MQSRRMLYLENSTWILAHEDAGSDVVPDPITEANSRLVLQQRSAVCTIVANCPLLIHVLHVAVENSDNRLYQDKNPTVNAAWQPRLMLSPALLPLRLESALVFGRWTTTRGFPSAYLQCLRTTAGNFR